jgi:hypothetical protein
MSKITFGRKFIVWIVDSVILIAVIVLALLFAPQSVDGAVLITFATLFVTLGVFYIGGNILKSWVKSRWFQGALHKKDE